MPKIAYKTKALREEARNQIELANQIIVEYQALEMTLTPAGKFTTRWLPEIYFQMTDVGNGQDRGGLETPNMVPRMQNQTTNGFKVYSTTAA